MASALQRNITLAWFPDNTQLHQDTDHDSECHDKQEEPSDGLPSGVLWAASVLPVFTKVAHWS